jgi:hypothetical protein
MPWEPRLEALGLTVNDLPLYGSEALRDYNPDTPVYVLEGEKKTDTAREHGLQAVGTFGAATKPSDIVLGCLSGFHVVLWPDNDEPGRAHMTAIAERLAGRCKGVSFVNWKGAPPKADADDFFNAYGFEADALRNMISSALEREGAVRVWPALDLYRAEIPLPAAMFAGKAFVRETVNLIVGEGGTGKSWIALGVSKCAVLSQPLGEMEVIPGRVLFLSEEMVEAEMRERLRELFTEPELIGIDPRRLLIRCAGGTRADTPKDRARLRAIIEGEGCPEYVFIDSLSDIRGGSEENSNDEMGEMFRGLRDEVARPTRCVLVIIHHAGKPNEFAKGSNRARGASVIRDICSDVILVEADGDKPRKVTFAKCRHGGSKRPANFRIEMVPNENGIGSTFAIYPAEEKAEFANAAEVTRFIRETAGGRITRHDLIASFATRGWSAKKVDRAVSSAVETQQLRRGEKMGKGATIEVT